MLNFGNDRSVAGWWGRGEDGDRQYFSVKTDRSVPVSHAYVAKSWTKVPGTPVQELSSATICYRFTKTQTFAVDKTVSEKVPVTSFANLAEFRQRNYSKRDVTCPQQSS
ncbi:hypothetical protein BLNAU_7320 [Blattamonas nauphoetae]|uniref:Uncharacterized protein n=1 Tax=Blattamonas nauphoetae TaxID=2049346 RepID=A0ABQ9Y1R4_9EUKA|nr:hypothetical protein BLNAU_7320 [Blattamonas nauphoetae]